jgi:hypothetical protein
MLPLCMQRAAEWCLHLHRKSMACISLSHSKHIFNLCKYDPEQEREGPYNNSSSACPCITSFSPSQLTHVTTICK